MRFPTKLCYFKKWHFLCERATYSNDQIEENEIHERKNAFRKGHSASVRKELKFASTLRNAAVNALFLKDLCFMVSVSFHNPYSNSASINCQISRNWDELGWGGGGGGRDPLADLGPRGPHLLGHRYASMSAMIKPSTPYISYNTKLCRFVLSPPQHELPHAKAARL